MLFHHALPTPAATFFIYRYCRFVLFSPPASRAAAAAIFHFIFAGFSPVDILPP